MSKCEHNACNHQQAVVSVNQTLQEMDFDRGLWSAALNGEDDRIRSLLAGGADADGLDSSGYAPLHYAARNGHVTSCEVLLREGRAKVNTKTRAGQATPLHRAAYCGQEAVVQLLLSSSADVSVADSDGQTPLHKAAEKGHLNIAKLLVARNRKLSRVQDNRNRRAKDLVKDNTELSDFLS